jgi:DNA topoisomerase VI subunit B
VPERNLDIVGRPTAQALDAAERAGIRPDIAESVEVVEPTQDGVQIVSKGIVIVGDPE